MSRHGPMDHASEPQVGKSRREPPMPTERQDVGRSVTWGLIGSSRRDCDSRERLLQEVALGRHRRLITVTGETESHAYSVAHAQWALFRLGPPRGSARRPDNQYRGSAAERPAGRVPGTGGEGRGCLFRGGLIGNLVPAGGRASADGRADLAIGSAVQARRRALGRRCRNGRSLPPSRR